MLMKPGKQRQARLRIQNLSVFDESLVSPSSLNKWATTATASETTSSDYIFRLAGVHQQLSEWLFKPSETLSARDHTPISKISRIDHTREKQAINDGFRQNAAVRSGIGGAAATCRSNDWVRSPSKVSRCSGNSDRSRCSQGSSCRSYSSNRFLS